jgi:hypothetical protein
VSYRVITTCNLSGWETYGRRMATTFVEFWPADIRLTVYAEGFTPDVAGVDVASLPDWQVAFKERYGKGGDPIGIGPDGVYNYRRDCVRFSHKVGAITDAAEQESGVLIWLDADTVTHEKVDEAWLGQLFPRRGRYIAWLDRARLYPECGVLFFDTENSGHAEVMRRLRSIYETGAVFSLLESHDSFVIEHIVETAANEGVIPHPHSLSGPHRIYNHPFVRSRLAERLDHLKGRRKGWGKSTDKDTGGRRREAYWREKAQA